MGGLASLILLFCNGGRGGGGDDRTTAHPAGWQVLLLKKLAGVLKTGYD